MGRVGQIHIVGVALVACASASLAVPAAAQYGTPANVANRQGDSLPPDFRGRITYVGTHEGEVSQAPRINSRSNVRDVIGALTGGRRQQYGGQYTLELTFNGNAVSGRYSGTGGMSSGTMSGTRQGDRCRLVDDQYGTVNEAICSRSHYSATASLTRGRERQSIRLEGRATQFVDAAIEEQQRQERERQRQLAEAEAQRQRAAYAASPAGRREAAQRAAVTNPSGSVRLTTAALGISLDEILDRVVSVDSTRWRGNQYVRGSMRNARYETGRDRTYTARGDYNYNHLFMGTQTGWVRIRVQNGELQCLEFHDQAGNCRPLGQSLSNQIASELMQDALSSGGSSSPSGRVCRSGFGAGTPGTEGPC